MMVVARKYKGYTNGYPLKCWSHNIVPIDRYSSEHGGSENRIDFTGRRATVLSRTVVSILDTDHDTVRANRFRTSFVMERKSYTLTACWHMSAS